MRREELGARMARHAIDVLKQAIAEPNVPGELTPAIRLALGWLVYDGLVKVATTRLFVTRLTQAFLDSGPHAGYLRHGDMFGVVEAAERELRRRARAALPEG